jgi:hypothetical protein
MAVKVSTKKPNNLGLFGIDLNDSSKGASNQVNSISSRVNKTSNPFVSNMTGIGGLAGWLGAFGAQPASRKAPAKRSINQTKPQAPAPQQSAAEPNFLDFLAQAAGLVGPGDPTGGIDFGGLRQSATQTANDASAKLQAMYNALHNQYLADAPAIQQNFDTGVQGIGNNAAAATGDINNAYDAARQAQTAQLAALGIGDAAGVIAGKGESSTGDQARAVSNVAQDQAAGQNQLTTNKASSLDYNGRIAQAASQQGTDDAAKIAQALQQQLAQYDLQEQQARAQAASSQGSQIQNLAQTLFGAYMKQQEDDNNNAYRAASLGQKQTSASAAAKQRSLSNYTSNLVALINKGMDPQEAAKILGAIG